MNIDKIVKECPKAVKEFKTWYWEKFENSGDTETAVSDITLSFDKELNLIYIGSKLEGIEYRELNYRLLFDYFDSVGIEVIIRWMSDGWHYEIGTDKQFKVAFSNKGFDNRTEAEFKAFELAFEIRNKQIEEGK